MATTNPYETFATDITFDAKDASGNKIPVNTKSFNRLESHFTFDGYDPTATADTTADTTTDSSTDSSTDSATE